MEDTSNSPDTGVTGVVDAGTWKALELECGPLHEILIVRQGQRCVFWDVEIFHNYVRKASSAKWLRKLGGSGKTHRIALSLNPHLDYRWVPSQQMLTAPGSKGICLPGMDKSMKSGSTVMATVPWLIAYLLAMNIMRMNNKIKDRRHREKAYHVLSSLVTLACSSASEEDRKSISTYFGRAGVDEHGIVTGDAAWEAEISMHKGRCFEMLTDLGSGGARRGAGLTDLGSGCGMAAMMWHWALLTHSTAGAGKNQKIRKAGQAVLGELLAFTANQLGKWSARQEEAPTGILINLQHTGKRTNPGILSRLVKKGRKRAACKSWREDGMKVKTNVEHLENKLSTFYFLGVKTTLAREAMLEIVFDSSMFGTNDYQVHIAYAPRRQLAAYLPPTIVRHIRWRSADAGLQTTVAEQQTFEKTGFKAKKGQSIEDSIRLLHHVLKIACTDGEGLLKFKSPVEFQPVVPVPQGKQARVWSEEEERWLRLKGTPAPGALEDWCPELPDVMLEMEKIGVLLATNDQKQSQWTMGQYLSWENFLIWMRDDLYHRSWRDFVWSTEVAEGGFHHTCAQLTHCFNVNYHAMGMHMAKRRELQAEWKRLLPHYGSDWEELCAMISLDQRIPCPRAEEEMQAKWQDLLLHDETYEKKGTFMRQSSWYNILKLIHANDTHWHAQKYHSQKVAEQLVKTPGGKKIIESTVSLVKSPDAHRAREQDDKAAISTHQFKAQLRKLRKEAGNSLLLAPKFYHTENCINARIMWGVGQVAYTEHAFWGKTKTTAESDRELSTKYSTGLGEEVLKAMWWNGVGSAEELARSVGGYMSGTSFTSPRHEPGSSLVHLRPTKMNST